MASPARAASPATKPAKSEYTGSSITVLEGLDAVRKRPGMYIGSTSERGLHHLVWEVVDNSVDEALAGHADKIEVVLLADGGVRVTDNGRGFPVDMHPTQKRPTPEVILTVLHAGGKFDGKAYAVSGGLHGVGVSVVNALSHKLDLRIWRDGFEWTQPYVNQKPAGPLAQGAPSRKHGTMLTFWADPSIFETTTYTFETISRRLQEMAFLNKGLTIVLRDERAEKVVDEDDANAAPAKPRGPKEVSYHYAGGIADFVRHLNATKVPIHKEPIYFNEDGENPRTGCRSRSPCSGTRPTPRASTPSPTPSTPTRAAPTRRAFGLRVDHRRQQVGRSSTEDLQGQAGREALKGDDIREGLVGHHLDQARRTAVRGSDQGRSSANSEAKSFVQKVCNRMARPIGSSAIRAEGKRDHRHQGLAGGPGPQGRSAGPQAGA